MCRWLSNIFHKPDPVIYPASKKIFLTQAIDDYPGTANDLSECLNDQEKLMRVLPDFQLRRYVNNEVCRGDFRQRHLDAFAAAGAGGVVVGHYSGHGTQKRNDAEPDGYDEALYLYDGLFTDDDFHALIDAIPAGLNVLFIIDSCFSGGMARNPHKSRFVQTEDNIYTRKVRSITKDAMSNCVFMSACSESETAYDGAFSPCLAATINRNFTYQQWFDAAKNCIKTNNIKQTPTVEGDILIINKQIFTL